MSEEATLDEFSDTPTEDTTLDQRESRFWGTVPEDWKLVNGNEVYDVNPNPKPTEEPNTYIEMDALDTVLPWPEYFGKRNTSEYSGKTFTEGDSLFARITPCTENGKAAFVPEMETEVGIGSTEYAVLSPKKERTHPWLLYYLSKSYPVHNYAVSRMRGSTGRQRVPFSVFRRELDIALPPLSEQRKIATVLYTVDQAIEKTEEIIDQIESVLSGATNELLIKGYKEKELEQNRVYSFEFQMPTDWKVVELQTLNKNSKPICYGIVQPGEYHEDGVPILNIKHSRYGDGINVDKLHRVSPQLHEKYSRSKLTGGEIVISVKGSTGDVGRVPSDIEEWNISRDLARISPEEDINRDWLRFYLSTELAQKFIHVNSPGSTRDSLNIGDLKQLPILLPSKDEQRQIADVVAQIEHKFDSENKYLHQLKRLKRGLMQDLLSGTVRTTDTNITVPDEVAQHG